MSSFYGGKQGRTYHIVQRYDSVAQMVDAFSGGGAYSDVNYGLYVIIDTILHNNHKSDPENGLLYRRGFDYNDSPALYPKPSKDDVYPLGDEGEYKYKDINGNLIKEKWQSAWSNWVEHPGSGAIYVGQIVGPQGESTDIIPISWEELIAEEGGIKTVIPASTTMGNDSTLVPKTGGGLAWNGDLVKVGTITLMDADGNIEGAEIAFDIPNPVLKVNSQDINPYGLSISFEDPVTLNVDNYEVTATWDSASTAHHYENLVKLHDSTGIEAGHPFYYNFNVAIPRGKKGLSIDKIIVEKGSLIDNAEKDYLDNNIVSDDEYITYSTRNYDETAAGAVTDHLGIWPYRVIDNITPILKIRSNLITWDNSYTAQIGDLYREDGYPSEIYWVCVKSGSIASSSDKPKIENATLANLGFEDISLGTSVWRVVRIPLTAPAHSLDIDYKAGANSIVSNLRNIDYLTVDKDGKMYVFYSDSDTPYYLTTLHSIENLYYDSLNGVVRIKYYGQEEEDLYNPKVIKRVSYNTGLLQPQEYQVHYDDGSFDTVSERTNVIAATRRLGDNLLFLYSDPNMRASIPEEKRVTFNEVWTDTLTGSTYAPNSLVWYNFGPLGAQYHVQGVYSYSDLIEGGLLEHGFDHVQGLEDKAGWLVTVITELEVEGLTINVPRIYAFDYTELNSSPTHTIPDGQGGTTLSHWYEVMSLTAAALNPNMFIAASTSQPDTLSGNGFWFVISYGHDREVGNG